MSYMIEIDENKISNNIFREKYPDYHAFYLN